MREPLKEIYELICAPRIKYRPMTKKESKVWEEAEALLGVEMIEKMVNSQSRSLGETEFDCFRAGFRLAVQLMGEGIR